MQLRTCMSVFQAGSPPSCRKQHMMRSVLMPSSCFASYFVTQNKTQDYSSLASSLRELGWHVEPWDVHQGHLGDVAVVVTSMAE